MVRSILLIIAAALLMSMGIVIAEPVSTDSEPEDIVRPTATDIKDIDNDEDLLDIDEFQNLEDS